jgi:uncharacterized protein YaiI (UPF0178 family)
MSDLHYQIIERYQEYYLTSQAVQLANKNHYIFNLISKNKTLMSGTSIPLASYDLQKNVIVWADVSNTLDKSIVANVRDIRSKLSQSNDNKIVDTTSKDLVVITQDEMMELLSKVSRTINHEILIDRSPNTLHIYVVKKILSDNR